jgi:GAF domain-containing protein
VPEVIRRPSRLRALAELAANAESSADALDRIARMACRVLDVPVALVNLVHADQQRFVGCGGPEPWASMDEMSLTAGFCPFVVETDQPYTLEDARVDPVSAANPAVMELGVVAYAGVPLRAAGGEPIGTLCALDYKPRAWPPEDLALLADLAAGVIAELQLLTATRVVAQQEARVRALTALSSALAPAQTADEVLEEVSRVVDRFDANGLWLSMVDESSSALRTAATTGTAFSADQPDMPIEASAPPDFLTTRAEVRDRFGEILEAGSVAVVPMAVGEDRLGVLGVCFAGERAFTPADREYLAALGGLSALALARDDG